MQGLNFKTLYLFTLSIAATIFVLALTGKITCANGTKTTIDTFLIMVYSGIAWIVDSGITRHEDIEEKTNSLYGEYEARTSLRQKLWTLGILLAAIAVTVLISLPF